MTPIDGNKKADDTYSEITLTDAIGDGDKDSGPDKDSSNASFCSSSSSLPSLQSVSLSRFTGMLETFYLNYCYLGRSFT